MTWILLEGLDRSGKTSVANHYKKLGYQIVHMSAPDKKYFKPGYNGESYLEEMVELYSSLEGKKVLFDRTTYGELIWPNVYGRNPMLSEEDIDYLSGIERNNGAERILMYDANVEMHWKRCVDNNEPLTRQQFGRANIFYDRLVKDYGFIKKQLSDFPGLGDTSDISGRSSIGNVHQDLSSVREDDANSSVAGSSNKGPSVGGQNKLSNDKATVSTIESVEDRLEKANAIRTLLQSPVLKKKGGAFDNLEQNVRDFLQTQLDELFEGPKKTNDFSDEETAILKLYVARIKEGMKK